MEKPTLQINRQAATLRGMVEDRLREAILSGYFVPGQRLVERELCEMLDVGRQSVREALRQLAAEGLIDVVPHRGPAVRRMTTAEIQQLYDMRMLLESYACEQFARLADDSDIDALQAVVEELRVFSSQSDVDRIALLNTKSRFYEVLMEGAGNPFLRETLTLLLNRINVLRGASMSQTGRLQQSVWEIQAIVDAIRERDGRKAARACRIHLEQASIAALSTLPAETR